MKKQYLLFKKFLFMGITLMLLIAPVATSIEANTDELLQPISIEMVSGVNSIENKEMSYGYEIKDSAGVLLAANTVTQKDDGINVEVNGVIVNFPDGKPFIDVNGRTLIPVRFVTEQLGCKVDWDSSKQLVTITKDDFNLKVTVNSSTLEYNTGNGMSARSFMDTKAVIVNNRTYLPIRFVAELLGCKVGWLSAEKMVTIEQLTNDEISGQQSTNVPSRLYDYKYDTTGKFMSHTDLAYANEHVVFDVPNGEGKLDFLYKEMMDFLILDNNFNYLTTNREDYIKEYQKYIVDFHDN